MGLTTTVQTQFRLTHICLSACRTFRPEENKKKTNHPPCEAWSHWPSYKMKKYGRSVTLWRAAEKPVTWIPVWGPVMHPTSGMSGPWDLRLMLKHATWRSEYLVNQTAAQTPRLDWIFPVFETEPLEHNTYWEGRVASHRLLIGWIILLYEANGGCGGGGVAGSGT